MILTRPVDTSKSEALIRTQQVWEDLVANLEAILNEFNADKPDQSAVHYEGGHETDVFIALRRVCCGPLCFQLKLSCRHDQNEALINVQSLVDLLPGSLVWLSNDDVQNALQACRNKHTALSTPSYELRSADSGNESVIVPRSGGVLKPPKLTPPNAAREILHAFLSD